MSAKLFTKLRGLIAQSERVTEDYSHFDDVPGLIWVSDENIKNVFVNKEFTSFTGQTREWEVEHNAVGSIHPDDLNSCAGVVSEAISQRTLFVTEVRFRRHDGNYIWIRNNAKPRFDVSGRFLGYIGVCVDIDNQKKLLEREYRYNEIIALASKSARVVAWEYDFQREKCIRILSNSEERKIYEHEVTLESILSNIHPEDRTAFINELKDVRTGKKMFDLTYRSRSGDAEPSQYNQWTMSKGLLHEDTTKSEKLVGISVDITEMKTLMINLEGQKEFFDFVVNTIPHPVYIKDKNFKMAYANDFLCNILQKSRSEIVGRLSSDLLPADQIFQLDNAGREALDRMGEVITKEFEVSLFGEPKHVAVTWLAKVIKGDPLLVVTMQDVTELKFALNKVKEQNAQFDMTAKSSGVAFWEWCPKDDILNIREGWLDQVELQGRNPREIKNWLPAIHPDDVEPLKSSIRSYLKGTVENYEFTIRMKTKSGCYKHSLIKGRVAGREKESGYVTRLVGVHIEITELMELKNRLEEQRIQLMHAAKFASLGELAANVAHDVNNSLNFINAAYKSIKSKFEKFLPNDDELRVDFSLIDQGLSKTEKIITSLRGYSSRGKLLIEYVNLKTVVGSNLELMKMKLGGVKVDLQVPADIHLYASEASLDQIILNLVGNAADAFKDRSGKIRISAGYINNNTKVELIIEDNGPGIPESIKSRIFEPFFTTKSESDGTGLGLYIVRSEIEKHGGKIALDEQYNQGARFVIKLPCKPEGE